MEYDKRCVCYSEAKGKCTAVTEWEFNKGFHCGKCVFRKTEEEYQAQTGRTYNEVMKEVLKGVRKYRR